MKSIRALPNTLWRMLQKAVRRVISTSVANALRKEGELVRTLQNPRFIIVGDIIGYIEDDHGILKGFPIMWKTYGTSLIALWLKEGRISQKDHARLKHSIQRTTLLPDTDLMKHTIEKNPVIMKFNMRN